MGLCVTNRRVRRRFDGVLRPVTHALRARLCGLLPAGAHGEYLSS